MKKLIDCNNHTIVDFNLRSQTEKGKHVKNEEGEILHKNKANYVNIYQPVYDPSTGGVLNYLKIQLTPYEIKKIHDAIVEEENKDLYFKEDEDDFLY